MVLPGCIRAPWTKLESRDRQLKLRLQRPPAGCRQASSRGVPSRHETELDADWIRSGALARLAQPSPVSWNLVQQHIPLRSSEVRSLSFTVHPPRGQKTGSSRAAMVRIDRTVDSALPAGMTNTPTRTWVSQSGSSCGVSRGTNLVIP